MWQRSIVQSSFSSKTPFRQHYTGFSISINLIFLIRFGTSSAEGGGIYPPSLPWCTDLWGYRCALLPVELSQTHPAFFLCHMLRKACPSTTVKLSRPFPPLSFIQSVPNLLFPSFSLLLSAASTSAPLPHLPQTPQPLDPSLHWFSLSLKHVTQTHIQLHTNTHALLMQHNQSQPPLKERKKYSNALFRI